MHLHIEFTAEDPAEFKEMLELLTAHLGERAQLGSLAALSSLGLTPTPWDAQDTAPEIDPAIYAGQIGEPTKPKRTRGRPRLVKNEEPQPAPVEDSPSLDALDAAMSEPAPLPTDTPNNPEPELPLEALSVTMKPEEMRVRGREMLLNLVKETKEHEPAVKALVAKYGVKTFLEVPDDKAQEFLADAMMLVAATTAEVA